MDKLKKVNIWRFVEGLNIDLKRKQLIGKLIEEIIDASIEGIPAADSNNIGGIKTGYTQTGKNYPVALDENKKAYVNVPWTDTNTTYEVMTGATASAAGRAGLVPAPAAGKQGQYLRGDGQWLTPPNTTYSQATADKLGLVKIGYTANGKNYPVVLDENGKMYVAVPWTDTNTTYEVMTGATASAAGRAGLVPAPAAGKQGQYLRGDGQWLTPPNTTYSQATADKLGLVKIGYTANGKNYPVVLDENGKMYVAVPWTDTKYTLPAATSAALGGVKQGAAVEAVADDADAATIAVKVNELITSLKAAGVIA